MDRKSSASRNLMLGSFLDLQASMQVNGQQNRCQGFMVSSNAQVQDVFPISNRNMRRFDAPMPLVDCHGKPEVTNNSCDEDNSYSVGQNVDEHNEGVREKKELPWQRVKWTDQMVKLLITAVSYLGEDPASDAGDGGGRRHSPLLPKKGKWKAISKVMAEKGYRVSPQQCEDKFNDLNKRYKKLNDILGRGTSCEVVENPMVLDSLDLSDKAKNAVKKILGSKQLFYQEMCSYHNGNRLYIPHDQAIQRSLQLALRSSDDQESHETMAYVPENIDEEETEASDGLNEDTREKHALSKDLLTLRVPAKRKKPRDEHEDLESSYVMNFNTVMRRSGPRDHSSVNPVFGEESDRESLQNQWFMSRTLQLEEQKLQIQAEMLELEKQRIRWLRSSELEDKELEKMRLQNEYLKLENERLAFEIKCQEMGAN
ncbi:sequence-specific DNA binding transcription factor [Abeliophyllum distichum]|uniref:Sequence-specific DNA binding transcription factor n=1 Tax=Abeliophyllum distichum TaxID=126358 RepID=A0ABD1P9A9_9LAMI